MSVLLYVPAMEPPEQVVHHAILYRDHLSTLVVDGFEQPSTRHLALAAEAGLYQPIYASRVWEDRAARRECWTAGMMRHFQMFRTIVGINVQRTAGNHEDDILSAVAAVLPSDEVREIHRRSSAPVLGIDSPVWDQVMDEVFDSWWQHFENFPDPHPFWSQATGRRNARNPLAQALILSATANLLARRASEGDGQLLVPSCVPVLGEVMDKLVLEEPSAAQPEHLLVRIDVSRLFPDPKPGVDTERLIRFRRQYGDERQALVVSIERLVEQLSQAYDAPQDIARGVYRDVESALADMQKAGRDVLRGWSKRIFSIAVAAGSTAATVAVAGLPALLAVTGSVAAGFMVNKASEPISKGWHDPQHDGFRYLYRVRAGIADAQRLS